jgi:hypothetical protein
MSWRREPGLRATLCSTSRKATLVGVPLFAEDPMQATMVRERSHLDSKLALLPKSVRTKRHVVKDDF